MQSAKNVKPTFLLIAREPLGEAADCGELIFLYRDIFPTIKSIMLIINCNSIKGVKIFKCH
jgi:hypothetical protein